MPGKTIKTKAQQVASWVGMAIPEWNRMHPDLRALLCAIDRYSSPQHAVEAHGLDVEEMKEKQGWDEFVAVSNRVLEQGHFGFYKVHSNSAGAHLRRKDLFYLLLHEKALWGIADAILEGDPLKALRIAKNYDLFGVNDDDDDEPKNKFPRGETGIPTPPGFLDGLM